MWYQYMGDGGHTQIFISVCMWWTCSNLYIMAMVPLCYTMIYIMTLWMMLAYSPAVTYDIHEKTDQ